MIKAMPNGAMDLERYILCAGNILFQVIFHNFLLPSIALELLLTTSSSYAILPESLGNSLYDQCQIRIGIFYES